MRLGSDPNSRLIGFVFVGGAVLVLSAAVVVIGLMAAMPGLFR